MDTNLVTLSKSRRHSVASGRGESDGGKSIVHALIDEKRFSEGSDTWLA